MENVKEKLKIGIDIDEVVAEFMKGFLNFYNNKFQKNFQVEDILDYYLVDSLNLPAEEIRRLINEFYLSEDFTNLGFVEGAKESIKNLSENNQIFFITSRHKNIKEKTTAFLETHFKDQLFEVHFSGEMWGGRSKEEICCELQIKIVIEDNKDFALRCAKRGMRVFLIDRPWNQDCEKHENIFRVRGWEEILGRLNGGKIV